MIHIANTQIEFELATSFTESLELSLERHKTSLQLQFLPILYAEPNDRIAVTAIPDNEYLNALKRKVDRWPDGLPQFVLLSETEGFKAKECLSWGASQQVRAWAQPRQLLYSIPDWQVVKKINSKAFSFLYTALPNAALLPDESALRNWIEQVSGPKVIKTCFGLAGQGNLQINDHSSLPNILNFCQKEWTNNRPIIGEPWLDRLCDFSTQWKIHPNKKIELLGVTRFESNEKGVYQGTIAGPLNLLFSFLEQFVEAHCAYVQKALLDIAQLGYYGFLGIDAFLYRDSLNGDVCLNPLVEINGRQTMSLVALRLQKRLSPKNILKLAFQALKPSAFSFLPNQLIAKKKICKFNRQLTLEVI